MGFQGGIIDPCLYVRRSDKGIVLLGMHVNDCLCAGQTEALKETNNSIKQHFGITIEDLNDYLSCDVKFNKNRTTAWIGEPHLVTKLKKTFHNRIKNLQKYKTAGTPGKGIIRPSKEDRLLTKEEQTLYRSGVGMLLFLIKYSRPDLSNVTRELAKCMDGATDAAMKEVCRAIKFVIDTEDYGLKIKPIMSKN